jgi:TetR/AcrR family transcriptional regulator, regulator of biofilm formation and stress response
MPPSAPAPTQSRRPPRGEARRHAITEAALAVIARVGPDGLTHRLVAAEANLPLAATTYWFSSKEDMVRAALQHAADRDLEHVETLRSASRAWTRNTLGARLADFVEESCTARRENAIVDCTLWLEALRRPELRPIAQQWVDAYEDVLADVLRNAGGRGTRDDAALLGAAIDGMISHQLAAPGPYDRATVTRRLQRLAAALTVAEG